MAPPRHRLTVKSNSYEVSSQLFLRTASAGDARARTRHSSDAIGWACDPSNHEVSLSDAARHLAPYSLRYGLGGM